MSRQAIPLSHCKVSKTKPGTKNITLFDGHGLFLLITPKGSRLWRFKYTFGGKQKILSFGRYPEISILDARKRRDAARKLLAHGVDPAIQKLTPETFEIIAREWHEKFTHTWTPGHAKTLMSRLERDLFPWIGGRPIAKITAPELLAALRRIENRGALETAHRIRTIAGQVFRYAVATGRAERDCAADLRGALPPAQKKHLAAITDPKEVAPLLRAIEGYQGTFVVKCALQLAPLLFVRPGELRHAEWSEIDFAEAAWSIPAHKMKKRKSLKVKKSESHIVPLSRQAVEILTDLKHFTGTGKFVFPSARSNMRPMSNNAVLAALRGLGYDQDTMSGHGFRAMARTILDEVLNVRPDFIEQQLAHAVKDPNGRAYNRTKHLSERIKMMQTWADYLDGLKAGAKVLPFKKKA